MGGSCFGRTQSQFHLRRQPSQGENQAARNFSAGSSRSLSSSSVLTTTRNSWRPPTPIRPLSSTTVPVTVRFPKLSRTLSPIRKPGPFFCDFAAMIAHTPTKGFEPVKPARYLAITRSKSVASALHAFLKSTNFLKSQGSPFLLISQDRNRDGQPRFASR